MGPNCSRQSWCWTLRCVLPAANHACSPSRIIAIIDTSIDRVSARRQFLADAVVLLSGSLDYRATLTNLANLAVPQIADWCSISMLDDDGSLSTLAVAHVDPTKIEVAQQLQERFPADPQADDGVAKVIRTGESEIVREITEELLLLAIPDPELLAIIRALGLRSSMTVPLKARNQVLGAITLVAAESGHLFDEDDRALAEDLANRAALTIDNARLYQQVRRVATEQAAVMERITDALVIVNVDEEITFMNHTARRLVGSHLVGQTIGTSANRIHTFTWDGKPHESWEFPSRLAMRGDSVVNLKWKMIRPDGGEVYLEGSASPVEADDGTKIGVVIAFRDETERKLADEARDRLAAIVEFSADAIVGKTLDGIITSWNRGAERLYGYCPEEVLGKPVELLVPLGARDEVPEILQRVAKGERVEHLETVRVHKDGQLIEVSLTVSPIRDSAGTVTGASAISRDITEQRRAQRIVERQAALLDLSYDAIFVREFATDTITSWNRGAHEMYGFSAGEAFGLTSHDLLQTVHPVPIAEAKDALLRSGRWEGELVHTTREGKLVVVMSRWVLQWEDGRPAAILETNTDISERKKAEEGLLRLSAELEQRVAQRTIQLESANRELEAFAYSVSHDLRAPLRSLDGFSQVVLDRYANALDERGTRYLNHIRDAAQEMGQLIDALLQLSRVTRTDMQAEEIDLSMMARSVEAQFREADPDREVTVSIDNGLQTNGDVRLLRVMLENLLSNAWKYTRKNPCAHIEFGALPDNDLPTYFIRDDGAGFDMAYVNKLFTPFQRLHTASEFEGIGVGLATVQRIIGLHGGRIWVDSAVGQGATFYFTLQPGKKGSE